MAVVAHDHESLSLESTTPQPEIGNTAIDLLAHPALHRLSELIAPQSEEPEPGWSRSGLAGRLCELSAGQDGAVLSAAMSVVLDAQLAGDPVAWVSATSAVFFPPDAAACGVDLAALVVVRTRGARLAGRAADVLLRSGAYGLVVLDLGTSAALPTPLQGRLVQLAVKHDAAVLCLTEKQPDDTSLGSLVSLRGQVTRRRIPEGSGGGFACNIRALKDKRRGPGWTWQEVRRGPDGLH